MVIARGQPGIDAMHMKVATMPVIGAASRPRVLAVFVPVADETPAFPPTSEPLAELEHRFPWEALTWCVDRKAQRPRVRLLAILDGQIANSPKDPHEPLSTTQVLPLLERTDHARTVARFACAFRLRFGRLCSASHSRSQRCAVATASEPRTNVGGRLLSGKKVAIRDAYGTR